MKNKGFVPWPPFRNMSYRCCKPVYVVKYFIIFLQEPQNCLVLKDTWTRWLKKQLVFVPVNNLILQKNLILKYSLCILYHHLWSHVNYQVFCEIPFPRTHLPLENRSGLMLQFNFVYLKVLLYSPNCFAIVLNLRIFSLSLQSTSH